jgi:predicted DNA-binding transcriptional regulator YafY
MRASRLLRVLLLLQNRGRLTCGQLAAELEVTRRTVLRDLEALEEAGLPVVVLRGARGGVELGFNYRTRLTGLSRAEAEALGLLLGTPSPLAHPLNLTDADAAARTKLLESLPDGVRETALEAQRRFRMASTQTWAVDARVAPLAKAVREQRKVRVRVRSASPHTIHPIALSLGPEGWTIDDALSPGQSVALASCGDINISALRFTLAGCP